MGYDKVDFVLPLNSVIQLVPAGLKGNCSNNQSIYIDINSQFVKANNADTNTF
jgi:hypothetical protein